MRNTFVLVCICFMFLPGVIFSQQKMPYVVKMPVQNPVENKEAPSGNGIWPKEYGGLQWTGGEDVDECYDGGYLITGNLIHPSYRKKMPILTKTDINGTKLWEKRYQVPISYNYNFTYAASSAMTIDGGIITVGATNSIDQCISGCYDLFVMKLNSCGEKEWCIVYSSPGIDEFGTDIKELPDGSFVALFHLHPTSTVNEKLWLMKIGSDGEMIWKKTYCDTVTAFRSEMPFNIILTSDNNILVSGYAYYHSPPSTSAWCCIPLHLKTDWDGNDIWIGEWAFSPESFLGEVRYSVEDKFGNYYTTAGMFHPAQPCQCEPGALLQTSKEGQIIRYIPYAQNLQRKYGRGMITSISLLDTNLFFLARRYQNAYEYPRLTVMLSDTLGNMLKDEFIITDQHGIWSSIQTSDKKILMTTAFYVLPTHWDTYLYKFNRDLEYDVYDPRVLTYDSLCPYAITSDTVALNCSIIVGLDEVFTNPIKNSLQIFPNPATEEINIILPESYTSEYQRGSLSVKTAHYQRPDNLELSITNSLGQKVYSTPVQKDATSVVVNLRSYRSGLYLVKIASPTQILWTGKFLKE
ncbi:MAG: T9SS type A sorting domain-containing protein [Bacteroidales bacterium]|nr:T9SS type A sorting domain-containing protein [Bacteroidales bacterium]